MKYRIKEIKKRTWFEYEIQYKYLFRWRTKRGVYGHSISSLSEAREELKDLNFNSKNKYYYE